MNRVLAALSVAFALLPGDLRAQAPPSPTPPTPAFAPNELLVRLTGRGVGPARLTSLLARLGATDVRGFRTVDGLYVIKLPASLGVASAARLAKALDGVAYAEPNYTVRTQLTPDDPRFNELWGLHNTGTPGADIHAPEAWDITRGSSSVVVAMIDTGIDYNHEDLVANMFQNPGEVGPTMAEGPAPNCTSRSLPLDKSCNNLDDDGNGYVDDVYGIDTLNHDSDPFDDNFHGTHTAGTVGASGNNSLGVVGVNWTVKLMPCKFLGADGSGSISDAVTCLDYVAWMKDHHPEFNIVASSNSWGGGGFSQALHDAIDAQRQRGILFIAAAGNDSKNNDVTTVYPASYDLPNVIAVAATTQTDGLSAFSNYGRRSVHIGAPGSEILSTAPSNAYSIHSGTSMATPHVAGVAALLKAQDPNRDWRAIKNLILAGGDTLASLSNTITGKRLNAYGSLACSNQAVYSRLKPARSTSTATIGSAVMLSALNINCADGAGDITVSASDGQGVLLKDDGVAPDQLAGDGIYSGWFAPLAIGPVVLTFPNSDTVTVIGLAPASYAVQSTAFNYRNISPGTNLFLHDDTSAPIASPFPINFGGVAFNTLYVSSNGMLNVSGAYDEFVNASLPTTQTTNLIAPFWDDLLPGTADDSNVFWAVTGSAPRRELVVEWRHVTGFKLFADAIPCDTGDDITFQVVFFEALSDILFNYADTTFGASCSYWDAGKSATIGVQSSPEVATQYSFGTASVTAGTALLWRLPGAPDITLQPQSQTIQSGHPATVSVTASGTAPLGYQWYVWTSGTTSVPISGATSSSYTPPPLTNTVSGWVRVSNAFGAADSETVTITVVPYEPFTDDSLTAGVSTIRTIHIVELRSRINALRNRFVLPAMGWADPTIVAGVTVPTAQHLNELRSALAEAYQAAGQPPPSFADSPVQPGLTGIRAAQIDELRTAVKFLEALP